MIKKIMVLIFCLSITTPCFAFCRHNKMYTHRSYNSPNYTYIVYDNNHHKYKRHPHRISDRTKVLATVSGIAGAAAIISVILD